MSTPDHNSNVDPHEVGEQELARLLNDRTPSCPSLELLTAAGQDVLPPEIEAHVQEHLRTCRVCTMLLVDMATLPEIALSAEQEARIGATLPFEADGAAKPKRRSSLPWVGAIAAALVLGATGFVAMRQHPVSAPVVAHVEVTPPVAAPPPVEIPLMPLAAPTEPTLLTRGSHAQKNPSTEELVPAFAPYNHGDYQLAATRFTALTKDYPESDVALLYLGVSQLFLKQDQQANATLEHARRVAEPARIDAANWYSAIAAQRIEPRETAGFLRTLCGKTQSAYSAESCRILPTL
jgi:hypothetical protein